MIVTLISLSCEDHMHASSRDVPSGDYLPLISKVWQSLWVYVGSPSLAPLPTAHCVTRLCIGSALYKGSSTHHICGNSVAQLWPCGNSASYLVAILCASGVTVIRQRCAFSVAGLTAWNGLSVVLCLTLVDRSALFFFGLRPLFD